MITSSLQKRPGSCCWQVLDRQHLPREVLCFMQKKVWVLKWKKNHFQLSMCLSKLQLRAQKHFLEGPNPWTKSQLRMTCLPHNTVTWKSVLSDHPMVQSKVVVTDRWYLNQGFPETYRVSETRLKSGGFCGAHVQGLLNDKSRRSGASAGLTRWSLVANFSCGGCFDSWSGVKATRFLAFGLQRQGKSSRLCKKCWSLVALHRWLPNTVRFERQTLRADDGESDR